MKNAETSIQNAILMTVSTVKGLTLFHNVIGQFITKWGGHVSTGLCRGSSDLIGYRTITITEEMVGKKVAVFTAIEVKTNRTGSKESKEQQDFRNRVTERGGIAVVVRSVDEFLQEMNNETF